MVTQSWKFALAALLLVGGLSGGCGGDIVTGDIVSDVVTDTAEAETRESFLFVMEADGGSLAEMSDGVFKLVLTGVVPDLVYFSDRPSTVAGEGPLDEFVEGFSWEEANPPNAAIVVTDASEDEDVLVVQLTNPEYDVDTATFQCTATVLNDYDGTGIAFYHERRDERLPATFGRVAVFIDDCPDRVGTCQGMYGPACGTITYGTCFHFPSCSPCAGYSDLKARCNDAYPWCCCCSCTSSYFQMTGVTSECPSSLECYPPCCSCDYNGADCSD